MSLYINLSCLQIQLRKYTHNDFKKKIVSNDVTPDNKLIIKQSYNS